MYCIDFEIGILKIHTLSNRRVNYEFTRLHNKTLPVADNKLFVCMFYTYSHLDLIKNITFASRGEFVQLVPLGNRRVFLLFDPFKLPRFPWLDCILYYAL